MGKEAGMVEDIPSVSRGLSVPLSKALSPLGCIGIRDPKKLANLKVCI